MVVLVTVPATIRALCDDCPMYVIGHVRLVIISSDGIVYSASAQVLGNGWVKKKGRDRASKR